MCVWRRSHDSEVSGRIEGIIGTDRKDRRDRKGSLPIVRDRKRSEGSEKLKNGRVLADNWKLGIWEFGNWEFGNLKFEN